jgi:fused signal recognition particle receptor
MNWFSRLKSGLGRSSSKLVDSIGRALGGGKLDDSTLTAIEDALIEADLGPTTAAKLVAGLRQRKFARETTLRDVQEALAADIAALLKKLEKPFAPDAGHKPHVVLVAGVNGSGKTTTIGKLAWRLRQSEKGKKIVLAAGDTFRAAAVNQLRIWGERTQSETITGPEGGDAASLVHDALTRARAAGADVLLIDTAGRLHNKADLMAELQKILRVIRRIDASAPHDVLLVLDATTGQNAVAQVETFKALVEVSGVAVTKLDGSARGGILVALGEKFALPVMAIGVGESAEDLQDFDATAFARALLGLET